MSEPLLRTEGLTKRFDTVTAVDDVDATFEEGTLHAIIGPNGAGKTTFFNLITGALTPTSGTVHFDGQDITDLGPAEIAQRRLIRSYQVTTVFEELSVLENVRVAAQSQHSKYNFWQSADEFPEFIETAEQVLNRVGLLQKRDATAANLSHGEQRTLELAIALATEPKLLLLDEPSSGMSSEETAEIIDLIRSLAEEITIVLVEHKMSVVMEVAERIKVLHNGGVIADGSPEAVRNDETVQRVYLSGGQEEVEAGGGQHGTA
jgi:branched-chain amino acid transport system ATP-binding protein